MLPSSSTINFNSSARAMFSSRGSFCHLGLTVTQSKFPRKGNAPLVSKCAGISSARNAAVSGPKSWIAGSPPVITTNSARVAWACATSSATLRRSVSFGTKSGCQVPAESHQGQ